MQVREENANKIFYKSRRLSYLFFIVSKRIIDIFFALLGCILLAIVSVIFTPFYLFGKNRGTPFFRQKRVGKNGKKFYIYKFRSMVVGAEEKLKADEKLYKEYIANSYKLDPSKDLRVTKFGSFIRKTSLDELPQFLNILKGEMSLVGPRPVIDEELMEYGKRVHKFLSVKPGLTGYWQVCGRSDVGYPERVDIELHYVEHASLFLDIKILFLTFIYVIMRRGAY